MKKLFIATSLIFGLVSGVQAADCQKPTIPKEITTKAASDAFNENVKKYEKCVSGFVENAKKKSKEWHDKAKIAADEWNVFVEELDKKFKEMDKN